MSSKEKKVKKDRKQEFYYHEGTACPELVEWEGTRSLCHLLFTIDY